MKLEQLTEKTVWLDKKSVKIKEKCAKIKTESEKQKKTKVMKYGVDCIRQKIKIV